MKKAWKRGILLLLALLLLSAAAGAALAAPSEIIIARPVDSINLDPVLSDGNVNLWVYTLCLEPMVRVSDDGREIEPCLAESWEFSEDNKAITFHIRPGIVFSNGTPLTGEDMVWSYERAFKTMESPWQTLANNIESVEAPDDTTFIVNLKEATPYSLPILSLFTLVISSKTHFEEAGPEGYSRGPIGTGEYKFGEWKVGESLLLEKNELYRDAASVKTDRILFNVVPDDNTRVMQLQSGEVDIITFVPYNRLNELAADPNLVVNPVPSTGIRGVAFNCAKAPTSDVRVRKAIQMVINSEAVNQMLLYGFGTAADSFINSSNAYYNPNLKKVTGTVEEAKALLAEAGYPSGLTMDFYIIAGDIMNEQTATLIKEQCATIGVNLNIQQLEALTWRAQRDAHNIFNIQLNGWTDDIPDPFQRVNYWCNPALTSCYHTMWDSPATVEKVLASNVEMDHDARLKLIHEIQQAYYDEVPGIPLYYERFPVAMSKSIKGFAQTPLGNYRFHNLEKVAE